MNEEEILKELDRLLGWAIAVREYAFFLEPLGIGDEVALSQVVAEMQVEITFLQGLRTQIVGGIIYIDLEETARALDAVEHLIGQALATTQYQANCSWAIPWFGWWVEFPGGGWMPGAPGRPS